MVGLSVAVTTFGLAWIAVHTHRTADVNAAVFEDSNAVVVSRYGGQFNEGGWFYGPDRKWLTVRSATLDAQAASIAARSGAQRLRFVDRDSDDPPPRFPAFCPTSTRIVDGDYGSRNRIIEYRRSSEPCRAVS